VHVNPGVLWGHIQSGDFDWLTAWRTDMWSASEGLVVQWGGPVGSTGGLIIDIDILFQAVAGLLADARSLSEVAREEASNFRSNYGHNVPLKVGGAATPP